LEVIPRYDEVISAINEYHLENGTYPPGLTDLVPEYLNRVPGIYIIKGDSLKYSPSPDSMIRDGPPFTFYISGSYPGLAFMHGWYLYYCPTKYTGCNESGDRKFHPYRIDKNWIWISSSAL
jgi:hypothetical protein